MQPTFLCSLLIFFCLACDTERNELTDPSMHGEESKIAFDKNLWRVKEGTEFPYRGHMVDDILNSDTIRALTRDEMIELLGEPSYYRDNRDYLYYIISQERLGPWPLHKKVLVIKFSRDNTINWIKVHE